MIAAARSLVLLLAAGFALTLAAVSGAAAQEAATQADEERVLVFYPLPPEHFRPGADYSGYEDAFARRAVRRLASRQAERHGLTVVDDWPLPLLGLDCYVMAVPEGETSLDVAERLSQEPSVAWAEPLSLYAAQVAHDDPLFEHQPAALEWRLAALHEIATGRGVLVAVIDSAVAAQHPDLAGQVEVQENFVTGRDELPEGIGEEHGAAVAGVIAALADNGQGVVGVAPDARLMALRACWSADDAAGETVCDSLSLAKALHFAVENGAQVINLSLSGPPAPVLGRLIDVALERDIVVVAAYDAAREDGGFPASHPGVVAVADGTMAAHGLAVVAPGQDVPTTQADGGWAFVSGSSYSAAHVSGLFALLRQQGEPASASLASASLVTAASGAIDACGTLLHAESCVECACAEKAEGWTSAQQ